MTTKRPHMEAPDRPGQKRKSQSVASFRWRLPTKIESDPTRAEWALRERVKELNCLYAIAQLAEAGDGPIEEILKVVVTIIPPSWQYPEITCARITFFDGSFRSPGFKLTPWQQAAPIHFYGEQVGEVTVCYLKEMAPSFEGPFLQEERALIDAIAERVGDLAMRLRAEQELQESNRQLKVERQALQETNVALKTLMARVEEEKKDIHRDIRDNVEKVLMPILHELSMTIPKHQRKYVELLRDNLEEITSPFVGQLSDRFHSLTPTEIQICTMIKGGLRTKEIAELRGVAMATINRHRERIRRKLGIVNCDVNLATFLKTSM